MKAVIHFQYGNPEVLQVTSLDRPVPQKNEVLIRVKAAGLDYGQWHLMTGRPYALRLATGLTKPKQRVLGRDVSGVVEAVGTEVKRFKVGDAVFGAASRTFAEFTCAREDQLCLKPERLSFEQAAASAISGVTALTGLRDVAKVRPGQSVCVIGAGGGVGSWAVQLARHFGARVTAVCSTSKVEFVKSLGATSVIDYTKLPLPTDGRFDVILDLAGHRHARAGVEPGARQACPACRCVMAASMACCRWRPRWWLRGGCGSGPRRGSEVAPWAAARWCWTSRFVVFIGRRMPVAQPA